MIWLLANWRWLAGVVSSCVLAIALTVTTIQRNSARSALKAEVAAHQLDIANFRRASEQARADNLAQVRAIEAQQDAITEKHSAQITADAARYRKLAADYARLHQVAAADHGNSSGPGLPETSDAAEGTDAALGFTVVPASDLQHCADAYAVGTGWQAFWTEISARENR